MSVKCSLDAANFAQLNRLQEGEDPFDIDVRELKCASFRNEAEPETPTPITTVTTVTTYTPMTETITHTIIISVEVVC